MLRAGLQRRRFIKLVSSAPIAGLAAGCSSAERGPPVPAALADQVTVLGIPNARFWADTQGAALAAEGEAALKRERAATGEASGRLPPAYFLAVSGGGDDGAFGSGLLCGW